MKLFSGTERTLEIERGESTIRPGMKAIITKRRGNDDKSSVYMFQKVEKDARTEHPTLYLHKVWIYLEKEVVRLN